MNQNCLNCFFSRGILEFEDGMMVAGSCHANPPRKSGFPSVQPDDWCGHWKMAPNHLPEVSDDE